MSLGRNGIFFRDVEARLRVTVIELSALRVFFELPADVFQIFHVSPCNFSHR